MSERAARQMRSLGENMCRPRKADAKRLLDILVSALALIGLAPLMGIIAALVRTRMGKPILFVQPRPGLDSRPFPLQKFRTMTERRPGADMRVESDGGRLTPTGRFLRRWSLDELPELWNVLRGDMSVVGPRPLLMDYLPLYTPEQARRHEMRPGLTGLAQVMGRNETTWEERLRLDVWYVDNWSPWLDLRIMGITVGRVLSGHGVSAEGHATMPRFGGSTELTNGPAGPR